MRLVHITDPHLSSLDHVEFRNLRGKRRSGYLSWYKKRRRIHRVEILDRLTQAVHAENADQILLGGDLVHIGLEDELIEVKEWLSRLGNPAQVMLVPGNHDVYAIDSWAAMFRHWRDYLPDARLDSEKSFPVVRDFGPIRLIGVSTACVTPIFSARGNIGESQLSRLARALEKRPGQRENPGLRLVLIHHPPMKGLTKWRKALKDINALEAMIEKYAPELILYGHTHRNQASSNGETRIYSTASASCRLNASYRLFDIDRLDDGLRIKMSLKSVQTSDDGSVSFETTKTDRWCNLRVS
jgi:3',5'-cyclic AMP phosphodiesterase CpdA